MSAVKGTCVRTVRTPPDGPPGTGPARDERPPKRLCRATSSFSKCNENFIAACRCAPERGDRGAACGESQPSRRRTAPSGALLGFRACGDRLVQGRQGRAPPPRTLREIWLLRLPGAAWSSLRG